MQQRIQHGRPGQEGARLDRVRLNEIITHVVFGGRRHRAYARITALAGPTVLDSLLHHIPPYSVWVSRVSRGRMCVRFVRRQRLAAGLAHVGADRRGP